MMGIKPFVARFDNAIAKLVGKIPPTFRQALVVITNVGSPGVWIGLLLVVMTLQFIDGSPMVAKTLSVLVLSPISGIVKLFVRRSRPQTLYAGSMSIKSYSFPSSHAYVASLAGGYALALLHGAVTWTNWTSSIVGMILYVIAIGVSRIYLGAHYPSDVAVGFLLGSLILLAVLV